MKCFSMDCDYCKQHDFHEIFILKKVKFSFHATKKDKKMTRVCWECAKYLFKRKLYNFGHNWRCVFLDNTTIIEKNKQKYMVIHA